MHLKLKAYCFGVPLLYTLLTISLFSLDCCEPFLPAHSFQPTSSSDPYNVRSSVLTTRVPSNPSISAVTRWSYLSGSRSEKLANGDRTKTKPPETESELGTEGRMASSSSLTPRYKRRQTGGERLFISHKLPDGNCSRGTIRHVVPGKFYITGQLETNHQHGAYQLNSAATVQAREASSIGQHLGGSVESWQKLEPSVECGDDAMTLTVRRKRAIQLLLDQGEARPTPVLGNALQHSP
ncbi:hypothetical protein ATANTOWER_018772 [Ataeniobius toweri]|uniref:Uncharacterized protein n=1 Tax=Ataeniobius toweri TaxID=208326 RepID=A0ABU7BSD0_9TELE|nr:hypothetical protein [Ataeniobius toweri]